MIALQRNVLEQSSDRRGSARPCLENVRSWTGRWAVARATDSHLSKLSTGGTRVTRVSAMRILPVGGDFFALQHAKFVTGQVTPLRRRDPGPLITSG
jgi:hypothetical protein